MGVQGGTVKPHSSHARALTYLTHSGSSLGGVSWFKPYLACARGHATYQLLRGGELVQAILSLHKGACHISGIANKLQAFGACSVTGHEPKRAQGMTPANKREFLRPKQ